jgi:hypothetical protein
MTMNYIDAFKILEIDKTVKLNDITLDFLKRRYHKLALQNHPDKNGNTSEYTLKFQQIQEAYTFLQREIAVMNNETTNVDDMPNPNIYVDVLTLFMKTIFNSGNNDIVLNVIKDLVIGCKKVSVQLFDNLDKDTAISIYDFLSSNRSILHLSNELLKEIRDLVVKKYDNIIIYKLNPSINDLLDHNIYKLYIDDKLFLVPLWYNEVYFDNSGCEIIVICEPELPANVTIDDDNNVHLDIVVNSSDLSDIITNNKNIHFTLGKKEIDIPSAELFMKREQYYRVKNMGLSNTTSDKDDIYDITNLSDLIVRIVIA